MHGTSATLARIDEIGARARFLPGIRTVIFPPATLLDRARRRGVSLGGQDCHPEPEGAHTGDISAGMLADAGAKYVILGHSERRADHGETDELVAAKARAAWSAGLTSVICVGETEAQYRAGETLAVLSRQVAGSVPEGATCKTTVIAYEPVWAIGTGLTPSLDEIASVHGAIRAMLPDTDISILYGGSVKPANASGIFGLEDVDGGLVGGASLNAFDFVPIMQALADRKGQPR